jgi:hypothetical protein
VKNPTWGRVLVVRANIHTAHRPRPQGLVAIGRKPHILSWGIARMEMYTGREMYGWKPRAIPARDEKARSRPANLIRIYTGQRFLSWLPVCAFHGLLLVLARLCDSCNRILPIMHMRSLYDHTTISSRRPVAIILLATRKHVRSNHTLLQTLMLTVATTAMSSAIFSRPLPSVSTWPPSSTSNKP